MYEPVIKWSGSKRSQATNIIKYFPKEIDTYYEPFCGGASVMRRLLDSDISVNHIVCSDLNSGLIDLWNLIKKNPKTVIMDYDRLWTELNKDNDIQRKKDYFTMVRNRYNKEHNPIDFMFLTRTCANGLTRYNRKGEFNTTFHITRNGIMPENLEKIVMEWSEKLNEKNVEFYCCSYDTIHPKESDYLYLDPPYANTSSMYFGHIDIEHLWEYLRNVPCAYSLSFDGISGQNDNTFNVPEDIYKEHKYIYSGNSSFKRILGTSNKGIVYESLYIQNN